MFGQLHHLAALGLPVPGSEARLLLADQVFTHFEREEDLSTLQSKLEEELGRLREILERATRNSVLIMNESFTSTTLQDAQFVGTQVLRQIIDRDIVCVCVTFVDELASLSDATVSMMSTVSPWTRRAARSRSSASPRTASPTRWRSPRSMASATSACVRGSRHEGLPDACRSRLRPRGAASRQRARVQSRTLSWTRC